MAASRKPKPALPPDALVATGRTGRIRLIAKRPPRRKAAGKQDRRATRQPAT